MAVDSHADNHYELSIENATNNNNSTKKNLHQASIKLESRDDHFGLDSVDDDDTKASLYLSYSSKQSSQQSDRGSARRKHSSVSKGITIEEFLLRDSCCSQLSAIDKLILKNKVALRNVQMKQTRSKVAPAAPSTEPAPTTNGKAKKEGKPRKERVLGSKIAVARRRTASAVAAAAAAEAKNTIKATVAAKKAKIVAAAKVEDTAKSKVKANRVVVEKKKAPKKEAGTLTVGKKRKADSDVKTLTKLKKKIVQKKDKLNELRNIKQNVSTKTRSFNKQVQLRNGKSRIVQDNNKTSLPNPQPRKYVKRSNSNALNTSNSSESLLNGVKSSPVPPKRSFKQEPLDDDNTIKRKRKKVSEKFDAPSTPAVPENANPIPEIFETTPVPVTTPIPKLTKEESTSTTSQPKPVVEEPQPTVATKPADEKPPPIVRELTPDKPLSVVKIPEFSPQPPVLSPAAPIDLDDLIVIDSTGESDTDSEEPPPVIAAQAPAPALAQVNESISAKADDQPEDTATETSEDTEGDEEFALQDANTESESIIDEDINLQYVSDDEDSTDKDIANEPTVAAVATAQDPVKEPKEPVESARQKITPPIVDEPKVEPSQEKQPKQPNTQVQDKPENKAVKESILGALGLQSLEKVNQKVKENNNYTGTLKAVIKIDKGCRRMELKPKESGAVIEGVQNENVMSFYSKILPTKFDHVSDSGNGTHDKIDSAETHVSNGLNHDEGLLSSLREANSRSMEADLVDPATGQISKEKTKAAASLVVPEKSSSFSVHPNRLCSDVCKYCFGKFGSLDTPCHVGQMKNPEHQRKILLCEPNLKPDTCLCDACYRFVDRKANKQPTNTKRNKNMRRSISQRNVGPCVVQNCNQFARHTVKRKWLLRISKKVAKLSFDVNKSGPRLKYGLCSQHYCMVDFYTCCGVCKKRLSRNQMYSIRSELNDMNKILEEDRIPVKLVDNMLLCKLCHYYMSLRRKYGTAAKMSQSNRQYYQNFRQKVLAYYNVTYSDSEDVITSECLKYESSAGVEVGPQSPEIPSLSSKMIEELSASSSKPTATATATISNGDSKRSASVSSKKNNHNVGIRDIADLLKPLEGDSDKNSSTRIQVKFGNLNIGKLSNLNIGQNSSTHQSEPKHEKSGDNELPIIADFVFDNGSALHPNLEKCVSTIQFDKGTKKLWQDLQKPYGNQSSFIRHLITLEKHWRSGAMVLSPNADPGAVKYITSVKNRIQSFEMSSTGTPTPCRTLAATPPAPPVAVSTPKPTPLPTLKPVASSPVETATSTIHYVDSRSIKASSTETASASSSTHVRHTPAPPPLLKIDQTNGRFGNLAKMVPSETKPPRQTQTAPQVTSRNAVSLEQYVGMMHPQPRTFLKPSGVSSYKVPLYARKAMPTMKPIHIANSASAETIAASSSPQLSRKSASVVYRGTTNNAKPRENPFCTTNNAKPRENPFYMSMPAMPQLTAISSMPKTNVVDPSTLFTTVRLPKALTVTQIDDPVSSNQKMASGDRPQTIAAPFLAGEKPSVSVFREVTK